jgi:hypothetical protein
VEKLRHISRSDELKILDFSTILQFFAGLRGDLHVTGEEGTWAAWLYDLLKAHVTEIMVGRLASAACAHLTRERPSTLVPDCRM